MSSLTGLSKRQVDLIDLDKVVGFAREFLDDPTITCYVEQTGGGCATIYLGDTYDFREGIMGAAWSPQNPIGEYRPVLAGTGWFDQPGYSGGRADPSDFSIGYDQDLQSHPNYCIDGWDVDGHNERVIARRMVQLYRDHPLVKKGLVR